MTSSSVASLVVVDELLRTGVAHVVLCPGSRSAPLAYALAAADARGELRLHVRVDERSAAFLALGLARASGAPAAVVTTSGTAVANLHPAVLEASEAGVALLVLSADRPPELRGTRANQTTDQLKLFGPAVRWFHELPCGGDTGVEPTAWRTAVDRAVAHARGTLGGRPGPVHLDLPLREPLVEDDPIAPPGRPGGAPWVAVQPAAVHAASGIPDHRRTLVVLGDLPDGYADVALAVAARRGWPVLGEPFGPGARDGVVPHGPLVLAGELPARLRPERLLVVGRLTLDRAVGRLLRTPGCRVEVVTAAPDWPDPSHVAAQVYDWSALTADPLRERPPAVADGRPGVRGAGHAAAIAEGREGIATDDIAAGQHASSEPDPVVAAQLHEPGVSDDPDAWRRVWHEAGRAVAGAVEPVLAQSWPSGPAVADAVLHALPEQARLFVGSSNAARDIAVARSTQGPQVCANRGLAGIDGNLSTAIGLALADTVSPMYALMGDLTFLHDANAMLIGPDEPQSDLTVVVVNDDGGGIFTTLEYGEPGRRERHPGVFERVFATPTGTRLADLCAAHGVAHRLITDRADLDATLAAPPRGITVLEVPVNANAHREVGERLRAAAADATAALG